MDRFIRHGQRNKKAASSSIHETVAHGRVNGGPQIREGPWGRKTQIAAGFMAAISDVFQCLDQIC